MKVKLTFFVVALLLLSASLDAKRKNGKSKKGKSGRGPNVRSSRMVRGSIQTRISGADKPTLIKCQYLERNYGEGAKGLQIRKCKIKRPVKRKLGLICEFGDFLCDSCEAARCDSFNQNRKVFHYQLAKKALDTIKQNPITKEFYCSGQPIIHVEDSCKLLFPLTSPKPKPITTKAPTTTAVKTTTEASHADCESHPNQAMCNAFMSWDSFFFAKPFQDLWSPKH